TLQEGQVEEAKMLSLGLGENHPRLKALRAERDVLCKRLREQLESARRAGRKDLGAAEAFLSKLEESLKEKEAEGSTEKPGTPKPAERDASKASNVRPDVMQYFDKKSAAIAAQTKDDVKFVLYYAGF